MSSPAGSPDSSSRKRKSPFESPSTTGLSNKRRRHLNLSLSKSYLERHSQQSNDSSFKIEDEDSRSITSVSVVSVLSEQVIAKYTEQEYTVIASKYGVNETVAKKYYDCLNKQPKVAIIKVFPIKRELLTDAELQETIATSPVLSAKKKAKKKLCIGGGSSFYSGNTTDNKEASVSNGVLIPKKLNKRVKENVENYLQTLQNNYNIELDIPPESFEKKEIASFKSDIPPESFEKKEIDRFKSGIPPESFEKKEIACSKSSGSLAYDSENEFEELASRGSQKSDKKSDKKSNLMVNPFSKDGQVQTSSQISQKKESQWKKFGGIQPQERKKLFLQTFAKNTFDTETENAHENLNGVASGSQEAIAGCSGTATKVMKNKKSSRKRKRIVTHDSDSESDTNSQTYGSLSVNCPLPFAINNANGDSTEDHVQLNNGQTSPIEVFGRGVRNGAEIETEDVIDLCAGSPESVEFIEEEPPAASKNLVNGIRRAVKETVVTSNHLTNGNQDTINAATATSNHLVNGKEEALNENTTSNLTNQKEEEDDASNGNLSDDLFDSPTKPDSPSDRLVIDLTPRTNAEPQIINISSSSSGDSPRPRGKPKIKSDTKLESNYFNIVPPRKNLQRQGQASPSLSTKSNESHTPSTNGNSAQTELNTSSQESKINSATPTTRGLRGSIQQVKCNLNDEESVKEYQHAKSKTTNDNRADDSFDKICQDLTNLSNTENVTLYRGGEGTESSSGNVVVSSKSNEDALPKEDSTPFATSTDKQSESTTEAAAPETATEKEKEVEVIETLPPSESPQSPQFHHKAKKSTPTKSNRSTDSTTKTPTRLTRSSGTLLNFRIPRKDPTPVTPPQNSRDPRLNRSLSPIKAPSATDTIVTRSGASLQKPSGVSPADPRLTRGQSRPRSSTPTPSTPPTNISPSIAEKGEEIKIEVDPRLRKRREREEAERAAKLAQEQALLKAQQQTEKFGRSSSPEKKRNDSPIRQQNEFIGIIKSSKVKTPSPTKSSYETDDDNISLHPGISDFDDSSDEDEKNSSPRHRKFESERNRTLQTTDTSITTSNQPRTAPQQQRIPIKQRIGLRAGDIQPLGNRGASASTLAPPPPAVSDQLLKRQARFAVRPPVPQQQQSNPLYIPDFSVPPPNYRVAPSKVVVPPPTTPNSSFNMNAFLESNARQMMQDQNNVLQDDDIVENPYVTFDSDQPNEYDHVSILDNKPEPVVKGLSHPKYTFFKNQCYRLLRDGACRTQVTTCKFQHSTVRLLAEIKSKDPAYIKAILDTCIEENFDYFLDNVWKSVLPLIKEDGGFTFYEKLYMANKRAPHFALELLNYCLSMNTSVEQFIHKIAPVIQDNDTNTVQAICVAVKGMVTDGFCWEAIKTICKKAAPSRDIVELVLLQCIKRKKSAEHIMELHEMVKTKMLAADRDKISSNTLKAFYDVVNKQIGLRKDKEILKTLPLNNVTSSLINRQSIKRQSVNVLKPSEQLPKATKAVNNIKKRKIMTPSSPDATPLGSPDNNHEQIPVEGESRNCIDYDPKPVASSEYKSPHKEKFWKLYRAANDVDIGLNHGDYKDVWEHIEKIIENEEEVSNHWSERAVYQILCRNIKTSAQHIAGVIKEAVFQNSSIRIKQVLFIVGMYALIDLGNSEYWEMALQLLNSLKVFEPEMPPIAYLFICAEIYLANKDPLEALSLLQRTKLIRTNRDEWLVKDSKKADEKHRNKLVFISLQALAQFEPERAVYLFKELIEDQYIYYYPIDLSSYVDKFTLTLLIHKRLDLVSEIATLVMGNAMTWKKSTYQELLAHLLPMDENLANQILDYSIHMGYYNDISIRPGYITVKMEFDYTEEEIYLILKRLVRKLTENLGPTIPRLKSSSVKVTLIFEDVPTDKRLYENKTVTIQDYLKYINKNKQMRRQIANILAKRFTPAIKLSQTKPDRFCKIMSRTLVDHLKHWH